MCGVKVSMETVAIITMIGTLLSAVAAAVAAWAAVIASRAWKASMRYERRCDAVAAWVGGAATFRGKLKFIYKEQVNWPADKQEIECLSGHFWAWVALWPNVRAALCGEPKAQAERLWGAVFSAYQQAMSGGPLADLGVAVEAIYNSDVLSTLYENPS